MSDYHYIPRKKWYIIQKGDKYFIVNDTYHHVKKNLVTEHDTYQLALEQWQMITGEYPKHGGKMPRDTEELWENF